MKISKRRKAIMDYIIKEVDEKGYPPSVREIGEAVGLKSSSTVHSHLSRLEREGYIKRAGQQHLKKEEKKSRINP